MARFDVRANLNRASRARVPFLVELQADMLSALHTCFVAPLVPSAEFGPPATRLNPEFRIGNRKFVMDTALVAGVPRTLLGRGLRRSPTVRSTSSARSIFSSRESDARS